MYTFRTFHTALAVFVSAACLAQAQQQQQPGLPLGRLDVVFPCGAKAGTSVEVQLTGSDLDEPTALLFSHPGFKAELVAEAEPKVDPKAKEPPPKKNRPAPGVPSAKFRIDVSPDVPAGQYDVRVVHKWGISNPRFFCVGDLTEVAEKEPNNDVPEAQRVELNTTINGSIASPTDVDYTVFAAKKGQRVVISCLAPSIDSRALPMIEVIDRTGKLLASNYNYNGGDAVTDIIAPEDGDYYVRLSEFTYLHGSPQHFYRLSISTAPWIDAVFPPMVEPGKSAEVTLYGRNLPGGVLEPKSLIDGRPAEKLVVKIDSPTDPAALQRLNFHGRIDPRLSDIDGFEYRLKTSAGNSNPVLLALATAKVVLEQEDNDRPEKAQSIQAPAEVAGRIDKHLDRDWYAIDAKKGEVLIIDLWSDRIGSPADLYLSVKKDKAPGEMEEDDNPDVLDRQQFYNHSSDPKPHRLSVNEDGRYLIAVGSRESSFSYGPRITYRLRIAPEKPDFRPIIMSNSNHQPDCTVLHSDGNDFMDIFVHRHDGFQGPITLTAQGLPPGVSCPPTLVSSGMKQGTLVFSTAADAPTHNGAFSVKASAIINGKTVEREARPATITWAVPINQNVPTLARLDQGLYLAVRDKAHFKVTIEPEKAFVKKGENIGQPILIKPNERLTVPFKVSRQPDAKSPITLQQISMGIQPQQAPVAVNNGQPLPPVPADKNEGEFVVEVKQNTPPGSYAVVMKATMPIQFNGSPAKKNQNLAVLASTTPLLFKVIPISVAKLSAAPKGNLKPGTEGELTVKVERQFDYSGEFKLKVVLPSGVKGLSVDEVTIPAGKDEATVKIKVAPDAPAGAINNVTLQAVAMIEGKVATPHEAKFNLTVDKAAVEKK